MDTRKPKYAKIIHQEANKHKFSSKTLFPDRDKLPTTRQVLKKHLQEDKCSSLKSSNFVQKTWLTLDEV